MNGTIVIAAAILPALLLVLYIYLKDKYQREPLGQLLKGILFGVISAGIAVALAHALDILRLYPDEIKSVNDAFKTAFLAAAIPEELAKLLMLWLLLRRNKYYDEYVDGIVYAVCVGMGFAGLENILYVFQAENWQSVAITRALFSVPGHYMFAVTMGYFYSMVHYRHNVIFSFIALLFFPILFHGLFDALLMSGQVLGEGSAALVILAFLVFFILVQRRARRAIKRQLIRDLDSTPKSDDTQGIIF